MMTAVDHVLRRSGLSLRHPMPDRSNGTVADVTIICWDGGPELLDLIRGNTFPAPVVIIGQNLPVQSIVACIKSGADDYVPLEEIDRLPDVIEALLPASLPANGSSPHADSAKDSLLSLLTNSLSAVAFRRSLAPEWAFEQFLGGAERLTGYSASELLNGTIHFRQLIHPDDREDEAQRMMDMLQMDDHYELMYRIQTREGELKWILEQGHRVGDKVEGVITDITALKQANAAVDTSVKNFAMIAENSRDIIWMTDRTGRVTYVSPSVELIRGYTVEEEMQLSLEERIAPQSLPRVLDLFSAGLANEATGNPYIGVDRIEVQQPHKDGRMLWMEMTFTILFDDYGQAIGLMGTSRDITARKQIESALRLSRLALERKVDEVTALYRATTVLFDANNLPDLNAQIRQAVVREFRQADCGLVLLTDDGQHLHCDGRSGLTSVQPDQRTMPLLGKGLIAQSVRTGKMVYSPDVHDEPNYLGGDDAVLSELVVPLVTPRGVIGALDMQSHQLDAFSEPDRRLIQVFATQAAAAIERMQLYEALRHQATNLEVYVHERTEQLQRARSRTQAILNNVSDSIILTDVHGVIEQVNQSFVRMFGYDVHELIGSNLQDLFVTELPIGMNFDGLRAHVEQGPPHLETQARRKNGVQFDADVVLSIVDEADTEGIVCSIRDVTERNLVMNELSRSEAKLRTIIDNVSLAMGLIDQDYCVVAFNELASKYFEAILGVRPTEGLSIRFDLPVTDVRNGYMAFLQRALAGEIVVQQWILPDADGQMNWQEAHFSPVITEHGQIIGVCTYSEDITIRKQAELALQDLLEREREANLVKSRFVTMASHDMRTPLTSVLSSSELLLEYWKRHNGEKIPPRVEGHFHKIDNAIQHIVALLDDIVFFGEAENSWRRPRLSACRLDDLCADVIDQFQAQHKRTGHKLILEVKGSVPSLTLDAKLIRRLLNNLVSNAIKYSPEGGDVCMILASEPEYVSLEIKDQGIGIPIKDQQNIFDVFTRASNVGEIRGTGLGLSIVEKIVELHDATISCESQPGEGTRFIVRFPISRLDAVTSSSI